MGKAQTQGLEYELFVQGVMQTLVAAAGLSDVEVVHNAHLTGRSGQSHQIDLHWRYRVGGVTHRVLVDCKCYRDAIEIRHALALKGVVEDFPDSQGVLVTSVGFQAGVVKYAQMHGIGLKVVRPAESRDHDGRFRTITASVVLYQPEVTGGAVDLDEDWVATNLSAREVAAVQGEFTTLPKHIVIRDRLEGSTRTAEEMIAALPPDGSVDEPRSHTWTWPDALIERPGLPVAKILRWRMDYKWHESAPLMIHIGEAVGQTLVHDALAGTMLFVDPSGRVAGDLDEEGIRRR